MRLDKNSAPPEQHGKQWSREDDADLCKFLLQHKSQVQIAHRLKRTEVEIFQRVAYHALLGIGPRTPKNAEAPSDGLPT